MAETEQTDAATAVDRPEDTQMRRIWALSVASVVLATFVLLLATGARGQHNRHLRPRSRLERTMGDSTSVLG